MQSMSWSIPVFSARTGTSTSKSNMRSTSQRTCWFASTSRTAVRKPPRFACCQLGEYILYCAGADELMFTENETNLPRLFGVASPTPYVKDAFHEHIVKRNR